MEKSLPSECGWPDLAPRAHLTSLAGLLPDAEPWDMIGARLVSCCPSSTQPPPGSPARRHERRESMGIIAWIILGLLAGALAKFIMPGNDPGGCVVTTLIGIAGAVVGGWVATLLGFGGLSGSLD